MGKRDWAIFFLAIALTVLGVVRVFVEGSIETAALLKSGKLRGRLKFRHERSDRCPVPFLCTGAF